MMLYSLDLETNLRKADKNGYFEYKNFYEEFKTKEDALMFVESLQVTHFINKGSLAEMENHYSGTIIVEWQDDYMHTKNY